jgi:hypothetical protein
MGAPGGFMTDQAHYFIAPVEASDQRGIDIKLSRALISRQTVLRFMNDSKSAHDAFLQGRIFLVNLEDRKFKGRLIREQGRLYANYLKSQSYDSLLSN